MYDPVSLCVLKPKSTQVQGYSAMLLPPAGTGCQIFQNASVFSATPKILFSTFYSPISFLIPIIKFLFLQSLLHPSQNSLPFSIIFAKPTEHVAVCMEFNCAIQLDTDINVCTCIRVCVCVWAHVLSTYIMCAVSEWFAQATKQIFYYSDCIFVAETLTWQNNVRNINLQNNVIWILQPVHIPKPIPDL